MRPWVTFTFFFIHFYVIIVSLWIVINGLFCVVHCAKSCCSSQPPRWSPMTQPPAIHTPWSPTLCWSVWSIAHGTEVNSEARLKKIVFCCWYSGSLSDHQSYRETQVARKWSLHKELRPVKSHGHELGRGSSSLSQSLRWLQLQPTAQLQLHERPWARDAQLTHVQIPDPQKLWHSKCLLFGVIWYTAIGN